MTTVRALSATAVLLAVSCGGMTAPTVMSVAFFDLPRESTGYTAGEMIWVTVTFDQPVTVSGVPQIALSVGDATRQAEYFSGSGGPSLTFRYVVEAMDSDEDGVSIAADSLSLNGGTLLSIDADTASDLRHDAVAAVADRAVKGSMLLTGRLSLFADVTDFGVSRAGGVTSCKGTGGYDDFGPGMNVTIRDGAGTLIASTRTEPWGRLDLHPAYDEVVEMIKAGTEGTQILGNRTLGQCHVWWVAFVPISEFYEVEVGRRGTLSYSYSELEERGWFVVSGLSISYW